MGIMQHAVEADLFDFRHRADVTRDARIDGNVLLAPQQIELPHFERLAPVADEQLAVASECALMHFEYTELADVRVHAHFEHAREDVLAGIELGVKFLRALTLALQEGPWIAFERIWQQLVENVEELAHAGTGLRRREADRHQMSFAQR